MFWDDHSMKARFSWELKRKTFKTDKLYLFFLIYQCLCLLLGNMCGILAHIVKYVRCLFLGTNSSFSESILFVWQEKGRTPTFVFCILPFFSSWLSFSFWDNYTAVVGNSTQESWLTLYVAGHSGSKLSSWYWFSLPAVLSQLPPELCVCLLPFVHVFSLWWLSLSLCVYWLTVKSSSIAIDMSYAPLFTFLPFSR